jgi:hypothetical protein
MHPAIHKEIYVQRKIMTQLLGHAETGLNRVRSIVIGRCLGDPSVRLSWRRDYSECSNILICQRNEWQLSNA